RVNLCDHGALRDLAQHLQRLGLLAPSCVNPSNWRFHVVSDHRDGCILVDYLLILVDRFFVSVRRFINRREKREGRLETGLHVQRLLELLLCLVVLARNYQCLSWSDAYVRRDWIDLLCAASFSYCLVVSAACCQQQRVAMMGERRVWVQFNPASVLCFR